MSMFCYQCQETAKNTGCTMRGVCGKTDDVSNLQDLLIYALKGISVLTLKLKEKGIQTKGADTFIVEGLFSTITNVNFDREYFIGMINKALALKDSLTDSCKSNGITLDNLPEAALWKSEPGEFDQKAAQVGFLSIPDPDVRSLNAIIIYGLKGIAAYAEHAHVLGFDNQEIFDFLQRALYATFDESIPSGALIDLIMETGKYGVDAMALLDKANTSSYGHPEITKVDIGVRNNPGILISGHDLKDLEELLIQTQGTGVDVYTHGEMLPAHYYPAFKKYPHFAGNYGNAWWKQDKEFESFNGPVFLTTNCLVPPKDSYKDRVYATSVVGFPGIKYIGPRKEGGQKDFSQIIAHAKKCPPPTELEKGEIVGGFAHNTIIGLADKVIDAVKSGAIKKFFVMAGCDGRMKSREYYTDFAKALPSDTVILTAGCAKYRYNKLNLGDIGGIPRVLDAGQCNDSYSLVLIALALKDAFGLDDVNKLPLAFNIAWYEQKAVIVLLALLYLGVKNIHLGPTLPGFLTPNTAKFIIDTFGLSGISDVQSDINIFMK